MDPRPPARPRKTRVTLKDIAAVAGVTPATVSYALNDTGAVSAETRDRVLRIADELGYHPNASARSLVSGGPGMLAIAPSVDLGYSDYLEIDYLADVVAGATRRATALGHPLVVVPAARVDGLWDHLHLDGAIAVDPVADDPWVAQLVARRVPLVTVDRDPSHPGVAHVDSQVQSGTRRVLDHFWEAGARGVALVSWEMGDAFRYDSEAAFRAWCDERGLAGTVRHWPLPSRGIDPTIVRDLVARADVDAVYCLSQPFGLAVLEMARGLGRAVPEDLRIACARDYRITEPDAFALTTLEFRPVELGAAAVDLLIDLIDGTAGPGEIRAVPATLQVRSSSVATGHLG